MEQANANKPYNNIFYDTHMIDGNHDHSIATHSVNSSDASNGTYVGLFSQYHTYWWPVSLNRHVLTCILLAV